MSRFRTYRSFFSALLLVVYAFIATPVMLWHHHDARAGSVRLAKSAVKDRSQLSHSSGKVVEGDCQVCSHQYSPYAPASHVPVISAPEALSPEWSEPIVSIPTTSVGHQLNKGPPALD